MAAACPSRRGGRCWRILRGGGLLCLVTLGLLRSAAGVIDIELLPIAHGLIIDAGSGGSRMHVYQWEPRLFATLPPPISFPESRNTWTGRLSPGISSYAEHPWDIGEHLRPLIEFAKNILKDHEDDFYKFPLYLRATGGMRQLPVAQRARIMDHIRRFLYSEESPFYFEYDFARVVSGEEEGIYAWAAINFLKGHLLLDSGGSGTANSNVTVGALDMGGASTQIAFFRQDQDIMSNLFKLQVGAQKHWNVYVHSFLYFGEASTKLRMQQACVDTFNGLAPHERMLRVMSAALAPKVQVQGPKVEVGDKFNSEFDLLDAVDGDARMVRLTAPTGELAYFPVHPRDEETGAQRQRPRALASAPMPMKTEESQGKTVTVVTAADYGGDAQSLPQVVDACMHIGTEFVFEAADGGTYALVPALEGSDFDACKAQVEPLLHKQLNTWCNFAHSGQCSLAGIYQPELPHARNRQFYAFSGYRRAWSIMGLPEEIKLQEFEEQARVICSMTLDQLQERNELLGKPLSAKAILGACFSSTYAITLLIDGYGFSLDTSVNFVKNLAGYKVGWALGSMLYEINALPWKYVGPGSDDYKRDHSGLKPGADPSGKTSHKGHHHKHAVAIEEGKAKKLKHKKGDHHYKSKKKDDKKHKKHHKTHHGKHKASKFFALGGGGGDDDDDNTWLSIITTAAAGVAALIAAAAAGAAYGRRHERAARAKELNLNLQLQEGPPAAAAAAASCVYGSDGGAAAADAEEAAALLSSRGSGKY